MPGRPFHAFVALVLILASSDARASAQPAPADAQLKLAQTHLNAGRFGDALQMFESVLAARRASVDYAGEADVLTQMGWAQSSLGRNTDALETIDRALSICTRIADTRCEARAHITTGEIAFRIGDTAKAHAHYREALTRFAALGDAKGQADTLTETGWAHWTTGDSKAALEYYERAIPFWQAADNQAGEGYVLNNVGLVYSSRGDNSKALEYFEQSAALRRSGGDMAGEAQTLANMAWAYWNLAEFQKTLDVASRAVQLSQTSTITERPLGTRSTQAWALDTSGLALASLGDHARALERHREALALRREIDDRHGLGQTLNNIGAAYYNLGDAAQGHEYFTQALAASRAVDDRRREALALNNLGLHAIGQKQHARALEYLQQALAIRRSLGDRRPEAQTLHNIARAEAASGAAAPAREHYLAARDLFRVVGDRSSEANTLLHMASLEAAQNRLDDARTAIESALALAESVRTKIASQELRGSYLATRQNYYELYIDVLMRLHRRAPRAGHLAQAFETSERARARSLIESLLESHVDIREGADPELLARERAAQRALDSRERSRIVLLNGPHRPEQAAAAERELEDLLREYRDIQTEIRVRSPRYAAVMQPEAMTLADIRRRVLDDRSLLLEYRLGESRSYLFAVTRTTLRGYTLPGRTAIETAARRLHGLLSRSPRRTEKRQLELAAANVGTMLLGPAAAELGARRLVIVADGILHYLPFAVLSRPGGSPACTDPGGYCPLIAAHEVVSLPSASVLAVIRAETDRRPRASRTLVVFSDPVFDAGDIRLKSPRSGATSGFDRLPFSRREGEAIAALSPRERTLNARDFAASREAAMRPDIKQYRFVHFATHGIVDSQRPELSGLVLSLVDPAGRPTEGFLRAHDLYNLNLGAELVVLSGCRTALGKEIKGEGIVSLARGFMYAGSPRVIASLWDVRDAATAELMTETYRGMLSDGLTAAAALRAAQLTLWRSGRYEAPFYWGSFILQGEWR